MKARSSVLAKKLSYPVAQQQIASVSNNYNNLLLVPLVLCYFLAETTALSDNDKAVVRSFLNLPLPPSSSFSTPISLGCILNFSGELKRENLSNLNQESDEPALLTRVD